jgi:hypothetical protein
MLQKIDGKWSLVYLKEESKIDILDKAGAGQEGTDELLNTYINDTPGQSRKLLRFKQYKK